MDKNLQDAFDVMINLFIVDIPALIAIILGIMATPLRIVAAFFEPADGGGA